VSVVDFVAEYCSQFWLVIIETNFDAVVVVRFELMADSQ